MVKVAVTYLMLSVLLVSCSADNDELSDRAGKIDLRVEIDDKIRTPDDRKLSIYGITLPSVEDFSFTLSTLDGKYSRSWQSVSSFPSDEYYAAGEYTASAYYGSRSDEGFDCPAFESTSDFSVRENEITDVGIKCSLCQALVDVKCGEALKEKYPRHSVVVHSEGGGYVEFGAEEDRPGLLRPGITSIFVVLTDGDGRAISVATDIDFLTRSAVLYDVSVDLVDGDELSISVSADVDPSRVSVTVTDESFDMPGPEIISEGFRPGDVLDLTEGFPSDQAVIMSVTSQAGIKKALLTTESMQLIADNFPAEVDLVNPTPDQKAVLDAYHLEYGMESGRGYVDFSGLLENIRAIHSSQSTFTLLIKDNLGRVSSPVSLSVNTKGVELTLVSKSAAVAGDDVVEIGLGINVPKVEIEDFAIETVSGNGVSENIPIIDGTVEESESLVKLIFKVPEGLEDVDIGIKYLGVTKLMTTIVREAPEYSIDVDAFATTAAIFVNNDDENIRKLVTRYSTIKADGQRLLVYNRDEDRGIISVTGLHPDTRYTITSELIAGKISSYQTVYTEAALPVPSGDFEDVEETINYEALKSGGRYSTSTIPIYNHQNFKDILVSWPKKHWGSVNDKTFPLMASNKNTWYMQPSSVVVHDAKSGTKAIRISSVGWDLSGEPIPDYKQDGDVSLPYNNNIPHVAHRSAGKLFLGEYKYDPATMTEVYVEGVGFTSRPSSLNGFFKYQPDLSSPDDKGKLTVSVINDQKGEEIVISESEMTFSISPDYRSFNLPLNYERPGIKATKVKIMFSSSSGAGRIEEEDERVPVTPYPDRGIMEGSVLWIDDLSFSY